MIKFSETSSFDFGIEPTRIINDSKELIKRASNNILLKYAKSKDQTDLHIIAVGAYEGTGFNRNGDMFKEAECEKNYHYFKTADRAVHRHHKNKPNDPKFGNIKAAAYNKPMKRIELIVGLDNDKCSDILTEQEKVGHTNWSMACKVAHDVCTACGTKAKTDVDRCSHIPDKIGEIMKTGMMIGMENPDPNWFEMSYVRRPADRIGMSLSKVASDNLKPLLPSDYLKIYTGFVPPADDQFLISKKASDKRSLIDKAAEIEKHIAALAKKPVSVVKTEKLAADVIDELRKLNPDKFFKLAADKGIILNADNFFSYLFKDRIKEANINGAKTHLPNIFTELKKNAGTLLNNESYDPSGYNSVSINDRNQVSKLANTHSLFTPYLNARFVANTTTYKSASTQTEKTNNEFDKELAKQYALYKIAALNYIDENNKLDEDLLINAVVQNYE
jgi:hypothetical protein